VLTGHFLRVATPDRAAQCNNAAFLKNLPRPGPREVFHFPRRNATDRRKPQFFNKLRARGLYDYFYVFIFAFRRKSDMMVNYARITAAADSSTGFD